jgi:hypothetical protein
MLGVRLHLRLAIAIASAALGACGVASHRQSLDLGPLKSIVVARDESLGRRYRVIGPVRFALTGDQQGCNPDDMRVVAFEKYGERVDAVLDFATWRENSDTFGCRGTAVQFDDSRPAE